MLYVSRRAVLLPRSDVKSVQRQRLADAGNNAMGKRQQRRRNVEAQHRV